MTTTISFDESDSAVVIGVIKSLAHQLRTLLVEKIMAQIDDLKAALAAEDANIDAILATVAADVAQIQELQTQLAAALASVPDLAPVIADIVAHTAALAASLPVPAPPAP